MTGSAQPQCADCAHSTEASHMSVAIGYYTCALQAAWLLHAVCNIDAFAGRNPVAPDRGAAI